MFGITPLSTLTNAYSTFVAFFFFAFIPMSIVSAQRAKEVYNVCAR
jgi:hypothetical protein